MSQLDLMGGGDDGEQAQERVQVVTRKSLYEAVMDRTGTGGHHSLCHSVVIVAALGSGPADSAEGKAALGERCKAVLEGVRKGRDWVKCTGLLLMYQKYSLHVIEAPPDVIGDIVTGIAQLRREGLLGVTKILYSHDVPKPLFQSYVYRVLTTSSRKEFKSTEPPHTVVADCVSTIGKLAEFISSKGSDAGAALDMVQQVAPDLLCTQGMLEYFARLPELDSVDDFAVRLSKYLHVKMDDDLVWPYPSRLYPYD